MTSLLKVTQPRLLRRCDADGSRLAFDALSSLSDVRLSPFIAVFSCSRTHGSDTVASGSSKSSFSLSSFSCNGNWFYHFMFFQTQPQDIGLFVHETYVYIMTTPVHTHLHDCAYTYASFMELKNKLFQLMHKESMLRYLEIWRKYLADWLKSETV